MKAIVSDDLGWIYKALAQDQQLRSINMKLVRALAARAYKLIRVDIPKGSVEVNYDILEGVARNEDTLPNLLGITPADNPNLSHPFTLTQVAQRLGYPTWHGASALLDRVRAAHRIDLRASDNRYQCTIKLGQRSTTHKWSSAAIDLLRRVRDGEAYDLHM